MKLFKSLLCKVFVLLLVLFAFVNTAKASETIYAMLEKETVDTVVDFNDTDAARFDADDKTIYRAGNTEIFWGVAYEDEKNKENNNLRYLKNNLQQERDMFDYVSGSIGVKYKW